MTDHGTNHDTDHGTGHDNNDADREHDNCYVAPLSKTVDPERIAERAQAHLTLAGLGCPNCATRVRNALLALDGVIAAEVGLEPQHAVVAFDPTRTRLEQLTEAVAWAGAASRHAYTAEMVRLEHPDTHDAKAHGVA